MASLALVVAGIPADWGRLLLTSFTRQHGVLLGWTLYLVLLALRSARPEAGLFGAIAVAADTGWLAQEVSFHIAVQAGLVFLLIHSLRWRDAAHAGAKFLRSLTAGLWVLDVVVWTSAGGWLEAGVAGGIALVVLAAWLIAGWLRKERGPLILPVAAGLALLAGPGNGLARYGAGGLVAVVASLLLFAAGIVVAWTRPRWDRTASERPEGEAR